MKMNGMTSETTQSAILDDKMCELMLGLLDSDYPVKKIKENKRFKRGVMVENKKCYLPKDNVILFSELYVRLSKYLYLFNILILGIFYFPC